VPTTPSARIPAMVAKSRVLERSIYRLLRPGATRSGRAARLVEPMK
jgi:hypothetical protein